MLNAGASVLPPSRRRDLRERTDGGDDEAKEHDLFQVLPPLTGIEQPYNAIAAIEVPGHGDVRAIHPLSEMQRADARGPLILSLPFLIGEGLVEQLRPFLALAFPAEDDLGHSARNKNASCNATAAAASPAATAPPAPMAA
jgi:hypothetical protein